MKMPITIVRITSRVFPDIGGPAKHALLLSKYAAGPDVHIINIASRPKTVRDRMVNINDYFEIRYLPLEAPELDENILQKIRFLLLFILFAFLELIRIHRQYRIDLVHAHSPYNAGIPARLFSTFFRVPYVYTYHGLDYSYRIDFILDFKLVYARARLIFVITEKIRSFFRKMGMDRGKEFYLMSNAMEIPEPSTLSRQDLIRALNLPTLTPDNIIILYVGLMIFPQKVQGMVDFLQAFDQFVEKGDFPRARDLRLVYIGDGPQQHVLEEAVQKSANSDQVLLVGRRHDVGTWFQVAELSALCSYVEGFPNVVLESMAARVPCIATDVGDVRRILGDTGILIKPGDIIALNRALREYFANFESQNQLKMATFARVTTLFDWKVIGAQVCELYKRLTRRHNLKCSYTTRS
jgi:glycosyltransferase involved in cell wall biosynthesis